MINSTILALKYRPQEFKDLIGQEIMAQTITNAIKIGKTPNAYLLTGIRGVGKTTTARLIAKALNCLKSSDTKTNCTLKDLCDSCKEIISSNHLDVLEMDAASKTGIDDVRELIENSKYSPTSAKFKIFIIDEVHMLSKQAFNGLLKTLEEPPPSLKFILATTEVRKIPVTILSRCQRFDLRRVSLEKLFMHLKNIATKEKGKISDEALKIIAKASEGSVRDAISLLDRALITQTINKTEIKEQDIREMLGIADRSKTLKLFNKMLDGNEKDSVLILKEMISDGIDAKNFLNDIMEIIYLFSRRINLGPIKSDISISESELNLIEQYSENIDMSDIGLFWQLTLKTLEDLKITSNENLMLEMYIMQFMHLKKIGYKDDDTALALQDAEEVNMEPKINKKIGGEEIVNKISNKVKNQLKNTEQIKTSLQKNPELVDNSKIVNIHSFEDLIKKANSEKEIELKYDLERNVKLVKFNKGNIDISFNEKLNKNFIKLLTEKLLHWTGERWVISLSQKHGEKTFYEKKLKKDSDRILQYKNSDIAKEIFTHFPDAKLLDVKEKEDD